MTLANHASPGVLDAECAAIQMAGNRVVPEQFRTTNPFALCGDEDPNRIILGGNGAVFAEAPQGALGKAAAGGATYMTGTDNVGNGGSGVADGDMDYYMGRNRCQAPH